MLLFAGGGGDNPTGCALGVLVFPASVDVLLFVIVLFGFRGSTCAVVEVCVSQSQAIKKRQHVRPENRNSPQYITLTFNTQKVQGERDLVHSNRKQGDAQ